MHAISFDYAPRIVFHTYCLSPLKFTTIQVFPKVEFLELWNWIRSQNTTKTCEDILTLSKYHGSATSIFEQKQEVRKPFLLADATKTKVAVVTLCSCSWQFTQKQLTDDQK